MNAAESREIFIREALVAGEFKTQAPFFAHNRKLIADIEALEHKARRPDVLVDDELIFAFYDSAHSGADIHNGAAFEHWRKEAERSNAEIAVPEKRRPDAARGGGHHHRPVSAAADDEQRELRIGYNFSPGKNDDGMTLTVPQALDQSGRRRAANIWCRASWPRRSRSW